MSSKRYFWIKLQDNFFSTKQIRKLRSVPNGDTYTIIYLKLLLAAMKCSGILEFDGLEDTAAEELALEIGEAPDMVAEAVRLLVRYQLAEVSDDGTRYFFDYALKNTGSESSSAERMRKSREKVSGASQCDGEKRREEKRREEESREESEKKQRTEQTENENENEPAPPAPPRPVITPESIRRYELEQGLPDDAEAFYDYYQSRGWKGRSGQPIEDWQACLRSWHRKPYAPQLTDYQATAPDYAHEWVR